MSVRTRFAPSPTGVLHLGSIRTALFCWLYAKHHGGDFVLRIEDTDRERSTQENVDAILEALEWLELDFDEGPVFQSERGDRYRAVIDDWLASGKAYRCYCSKEELQQLRERQMSRGEPVRYDGRCRDRSAPASDIDPVVRFKNPTEGSVVVNDLVRGRVTFDNQQLDDLVIARSDGSATYNFSVVIDDCDMQVTHVIRGDDHLNNTPRQINMFSALEATAPTFAHLPMILGSDGAKLSKRHGAVDIRDYRDQGFLPEAMLNYLVRLGWSHGDQEIFSVAEMIRLFDIADVNQSASAFNPGKLRWVNQQHIMKALPTSIGKRLTPYLLAAGLNPDNGPDAARLAEGFRERAETLSEMANAARYCYEDFADFEQNAAKKHLRPAVLEPLRSVADRLGDLSAWHREAIEEQILAVAAAFEIKMGKIGQPIRVAVTGGGVSPPIDVTLELVGKRRSMERLNRAIEFIENRAAEGQ